MLQELASPGYACIHNLYCAMAIAFRLLPPGAMANVVETTPFAVLALGMRETPLPAVA